MGLYHVVTLQVGMVAHSARLNVYGSPSSRGLHNVTAVSRFLLSQFHLYFHKRLSDAFSLDSFSTTSV